jgi:GxxExxY protein
MGRAVVTELLPAEPPVEADEIAHQVIGAAIEVHRALGPGLLEAMYQRALCMELGLRGVAYATEVPLEATYRGQAIGTLRLDLLVGGLVVVELKAVELLLPIHAAQTRSYLRLTGLRLGLVINFNATTLKGGIKRVVNSY